MSFRYLLPHPHGHHYYQTAQLAAFAVYVLLLLGQGYRRGYPQRSWLPLLAAATLALVLGCQLVLLPPSRWLAWLGGDPAVGQLLAAGPRAAFGGAVASFLAVVALKRQLGFRGWGVLDAFAGPLCWALAVQSVGCVLAGCCWGEATAGNWGFAYGPGTPAYAAQLARGLLEQGAAHTPGLVPTQLLHLLLCAGTGLALHQVRHRAAHWPGGSRYLLAMGLLCLGRFVVEGWRDPASEPLLASPYAFAGVSLTGFRWVMLLEAAGQLSLWAWLVQQAPAPGADLRPTPPRAAPMLVGLGLLVVTARLAPAVLSLPEIAVLQALLLLALLAEGYTWLVTLGRGVPRLAGVPLSLLLGGALLLATAQAPAPRRQEPGRELTFSAGTLRGHTDEYLSGGCGGSSHTYSHNSRAGGAELTYRWRADTVRRGFTSVGGGIWLGNDNITAYKPQYGYDSGFAARHQLYDLHAYVESHRRSKQGTIDLSYRVGVHYGALYTSADNTTITLLPEFMLAAGNRRLLFGQVDAGYGPENALGSYTTRLALGSGLGQRHGSAVLLGYAAASNYPEPGMGFVSATLRAPGHSPLRGLSLEPYFATNFDRHNLLSVKLHYRLGLK